MSGCRGASKCTPMGCESCSRLQQLAIERPMANVYCTVALCSRSLRGLLTWPRVATSRNDHAQLSTSAGAGSGRPVVRFSQSRFSGKRGRKIGADEPVLPGVVSPRRPVPDHITKTPYYNSGVVEPTDEFIYLHTEETLGPMREACAMARRMLDFCCSLAKPGVTTDEIDAAVHAAIVAEGACPSPLNYHGFPKAVCSSVNEVACHAIPDSRALKHGDIVSFDVSLFYKGFHGDNCATVGVGIVDEEARRLMDATQEALQAGIAVCQPGACLTMVGEAIHGIADQYGYDTMRRYCGHGVGKGFHMQPFVQHFRNQDRLELMPGMTFTIEPILTEGSQRAFTWPDGWAVVTSDGGRAAQFEHVILVTDAVPEGHEVLTVPEPVLGRENEPKF